MKGLPCLILISPQDSPRIKHLRNGLKMFADILKKNPSKISKYLDFSYNNCNKFYYIKLKETVVLVISKIPHFLDIPVGNYLPPLS